MNENVAVFNAKVYHSSILHYIQFEKALESDFYVHALGRTGHPDENITQDNSVFDKYTGLSVVDSDPSTGEIVYDNPLIEMPTDIIYHILEKEVQITGIDEDSLIKARQGAISTKLAFAVKEEVDVKNLFQEISKSSNIIPKFRNNSNFGFVAIKKEYGIQEVDMTIKNKDIISYSFSRTPISEINTIVNVKYKYDYAKDEYTRQTGYIDGYDFFGNGDSHFRMSVLNGTSDTELYGYSYDSLGIGREDKVLEFESKYIRDEDSAKALRDFLYSLHCNQHTKFDLRLPLKYCMLEVGDVIDFDQLIDGHKAYGEDYTETTRRNAQIIYPLFLIESISKKEKDIQVRVVQLHSLNRDFYPIMGSTNRAVGIDDQYDPLQVPLLIIDEDVNQLEDFILGFEKYFTSEQKRVSDLVPNGYIDEDDLEHMQGLTSLDGFLYGDVNADGQVNVTDAVTIVNQILGIANYGDDSLFDVNQDGVLSVIDIVALVNVILTAD